MLHSDHVLVPFVMCFFVPNFPLNSMNMNMRDYCHMQYMCTSQIFLQILNVAIHLAIIPGHFCLVLLHILEGCPVLDKVIVVPHSFHLLVMVFTVFHLIFKKYRSASKTQNMLCKLFVDQVQETAELSMGVNHNNFTDHSCIIIIFEHEIECDLFIWDTITRRIIKGFAHFCDQF